jgi:large subunit ribosomal protein L22
MEAIAKTKYLKGSPRKARLVIDLIRGRNVSQALAILKFTDKRAADPIAKTLRSAIANATYLAEQQNIAIDPDDLWVKTCFVDMGPTKNRRRMRPAPQGRAYREQRHYCHITIQVTSEAQEDKKKKGAPAGDETRVKGKKLTAKTEGGAAKSTKTAKKAEEVETTATAQPVEETVSDKATTASKQTAEDLNAATEAQASDAKDVTSQTEAEQNETKPADDAQLDRNEQLERQ